MTSSTPISSLSPIPTTISSYIPTPTSLPASESLGSCECRLMVDGTNMCYANGDITSPGQISQTLCTENNYKNCNSFGSGSPSHCKWVGTTPPPLTTRPPVLTTQPPVLTTRPPVLTTQAPKNSNAFIIIIVIIILCVLGGGAVYMNKKKSSDIMTPLIQSFGKLINI